MMLGAGCERQKYKQGDEDCLQQYHAVYCCAPRVRVLPLWSFMLPKNHLRTAVAV